jgi:hypothetical protein
MPRSAIAKMIESGTREFVAPASPKPAIWFQQTANLSPILGRSCLLLLGGLTQGNYYVFHEIDP